MMSPDWTTAGLAQVTVVQADTPVMKYFGNTQEETSETTHVEPTPAPVFPGGSPNTAARTRPATVHDGSASLARGSTP